MKKTLIFSLIIIMFTASKAQELVVPLESNALLEQNRKLQHKSFKSSEDPIILPFRDDFSNNSIYPDQSLWEDNWVFINSNLGPEPPSIGMATFDALDDTGAVYSNASSTPFTADYLTSKPIRLDSIFSGVPDTMNLSDSIYLSFYYQPQGYGNDPNTEDSLILQFYTSADSAWHTVWGVSGQEYEDFYAQYQRPFKLVMIPVNDTKYLKSDFRFRFKNYASIANFNIPSWQSNMDQWNIDYVYLNYGRTITDTLFPDVAYVEPASTMLKNYMQMPSRQFNQSELRSNFNLKISDLYYLLNNIECEYNISEVNGSFTYNKSGGFYDILPFYTNGYHTWGVHTNPSIDFTLPSMAGDDSVAFDITHIITNIGWADSIPSNDTLCFRQEFYNYYAYDDGTAELGYGLAGTNSKMAYKFSLNNSDTLGAIKIFFNRTYTLADSRYFYLMVWSSLDPEEVVYKSSRYKPYYEDSLNKFYTYYIEDTNIILSGTFYIGWQQVADENLNVGYDMNNDPGDKVFYNVAGSWEHSEFDGALMIRPVFGTAGHQKKLPAFLDKDEPALVIYPNPANDEYVYPLLSEKYSESYLTGEMEYSIYNATGVKVDEGILYDKIPVISLQSGMFWIRIFDKISGDILTGSFAVMH